MRSIKKGFTLIEVLVTVGITALLAIAALEIGGSALPRANLDDARLQALETLSRARTESMNGVNGVLWGVHFDASQFVLFSNSYDRSNTENEIHGTGGGVTISSSLQGGGSDVIFDRRGGVASYGTITITSNQGDARTISVSQQGKIE